MTKRETLKLDGVDPIQAWRYAAAYFPPLDGSSHEVTELPPAKTEAGELDGDSVVLEKLPPPKYKPPVEKPVVDEIYLDGDVPVVERAPKPAAAKVAVEKPLTPAARRKLERAEAAAKAAPPLDPTDDPETEDYSDLKAKNEGERELLIFARLHKKVPKARRAKSLDVIDWVLNNLDEPIEEIHHKDIPSRGALSMLKLAKLTPKGASDFLKDHWSKTLPSKADIASQGKSGDRHAKQYRMIDDFDKNFFDREDAAEEEREREDD